MNIHDNYCNVIEKIPLLMYKHDMLNVQTDLYRGYNKI